MEVTSIAITFVPQTVTRFTEIREAQALRGHRVRRIGDLLPLIIPLLAGGMERSMDLAEAMEARGYGRPGATRALRPSWSVVDRTALIAAGVLSAGEPTGYGLADGPKALAELENRATIGKLALLP